MLENLPIWLVFVLIALPMLAVFGLQMFMQRREWNRRLGRIAATPGLERSTLEQAQSLRKKQQDEGFFKFLSSERMLARLQRAGLTITPSKYWLMCFSAVVIVTLFVFLLSLKGWAFSLCLGIIIGIGTPHFIIGKMGERRIKQFIKLFPDAIDLIVRGLRSGLPVAESMKVVATEIAEPVGSVFARMTERIKLGVTLEGALLEASKELNSTEFNFFVTSIILQRETGGNLGEILDNLATVLRARMMMRLKIKAMSAEARASAMIVGILPFGVILALKVVAPNYLDPLFDDTRGNLAAFVAMAMMGTGIFIMAKMAKFEI
jgi:tight adherence protein B